MVHIELPKEYSYVIGAGLFSTFVLAYLGGRVGQARSKCGVKLPSLYADEARAEKDENARIFNCIQRGTQRFVLDFLSSHREQATRTPSRPIPRC